MQLGAVRGLFRTLEWIAPPLGARLAARLWFSVPRRGGGIRQARTSGGERFQVPVDGRLVTGRAWGAGPAVYLLHGWGGRLDQFDTLAAGLVAAGYRAVAFDAPSHGESAPGPSGRGRSTLMEFADALSAVIDVHGPAHGIVAHSLGCTAAAMALADGVTARRVVFIAPMARPIHYTRVFARRLGFGERVRGRMVELIERHVELPFSAFDVPEIAGAVATPPVLLIHDRDDRETTWSDSAAIAQTWSDARLVTMTGLGHHRILRAPAVVDEVSAFLAATEPPQAAAAS